MKTLRYTDGPEVIDMMAAGKFERGVYREVPDDLAILVQRHDDLKWQEAPVSVPEPTGKKTKEG